MNNDEKIYIAGHKGMVGSAICRKLQAQGYHNLIGRTKKELNLTSQKDVALFFKNEKPDYVFVTAAKVGGILANSTYKAQFIYENLMIQSNIIHHAYLNGVKKLVFMGSSCIYPKFAPQPIKEEALMTGPLEPTNEPYAIAKIAGIKLCESYYSQYGVNFISVMPTNLYGPNDNYDMENSHVLPALIRKFFLAKTLEDNKWDILNKNLSDVIKDKNISKERYIHYLKDKGIFYDDKKLYIRLWGSGNGYREFLHVDDLADATIHIMKNINAADLYDKLKQSHINIGTGKDLKIIELAELIKKTAGTTAEILWDKTKPDGAPRKQLDVSLLKDIGWSHKISLKEGIKSVYKNYYNVYNK
jgi:GDP-L-fucose synthase